MRNIVLEMFQGAKVSMITRKALQSNQALSRQHQPAILDLARSLSASDRVTIVIGAGFSMDAGLPSWDRLVASLARGIKAQDGVSMADMALADRDDVMRKAEYVISMRMKSDGYGLTEDLVRRALYDDHPGVGPGPLLRALAKLVASLGNRVSILTTNFDELIETALAENRPPITAVPHTLSQISQWTQALSGSRSPNEIPIFHLHGRVARTHGEAEDLVVLTESHFLRHGPAVRKVVVEALDTSTVVFLGLSMTDPNLVGPLWDTRNQRNPSFVITVPGVIGENSLSDSRAYALAKNAYLEETLKVSPIFLKSYSQLEQLIYEMVIAIKDLDRHELPSGDPRCTAHGARLTRVLNTAYTEVGRRKNHVVPVDTQSEQLRERLTDTLGTRTKPGRLLSVLQEFRDDEDVQNRLEALTQQLAVRGPAEEEFSVHLWLRERARTKGGAAKYALRLVGSSDHSYYARTAHWAPACEIEDQSENMAARAAAKGKAQLWRVLPELSMGGTWRGVFASPVRVYERLDFDGDAVRVPMSIGAICLFTTNAIKVTSEPLPDKSPLSILSATDTMQRQRLASTLEGVAQEILQTTNAD